MNPVLKNQSPTSNPTNASQGLDPLATRDSAHFVDTLRTVREFHADLSRCHETILEVERKLDVGDMINGTKAQYANDSHAQALDFLKEPLLKMYLSVGQEKNDILDTIEKKIIAAFQENDEFIDSRTGRLKAGLQKGIISIVSRVCRKSVNDSSYREDLSKLEAISTLMPQALRKLSQLESAVDPSVKSLDSVKAFLQSDADFLKGSKLYSHTPDVYVNATELAKVKAFYEGHRDTIFLEFGGKLSTVGGGSVGEVVNTTADAEAKLTALQKKAEGMLELLCKSAAAKETVDDAAKEIKLAGTGPVSFVSKDSNTVTSFSQNISDKLRTLWKQTVGEAVESYEDARRRFLSADSDYDAKDLENKVKNLEQQHKDADQLIKAVGQTLSPFAVMSQVAGFEQTPAYEVTILGMENPARTAALSVYKAFQTSAENSVSGALDLMDRGTKFVTQLVEGAAWRKDLLDATVLNGIDNAPAASEYLKNLALGKVMALETIETEARKNAAILNSREVFEFLGEKISEVGQRFFTAVSTEACKVNVEERFANPQHVEEQIGELGEPYVLVGQAQKLAEMLNVLPHLANNGDFVTDLLRRALLNEKIST
jgi:hypothetical protein